MALQTFIASQVLTAAQMNTLQANDYNQTVSTKTGSYVLVAADKGTTIVMNSASATTITVNTSLFNAGDTLRIQNIGTGSCVVTAGTATVTTAGTLTIPQWGGGILSFTSASASVYFPSAFGASPGLVCVKSETAFSGVSTVTVDNVFTSSYSQYLAIISWSQTNPAGVGYVNFRSGGVTNSSANYGNQTTYFTTTSVFARNASGATNIPLIPNLGQNGAMGSINIYNPQLVSQTQTFSNFTNDNGSVPVFGVGGYQATTQFDGILFGISLGTMTGIYSIYGFGKTA